MNTLNSLSNKSGAKHLELISFLISMYADKDDLILDSFSGSGTTGHAALQLNKEDGGNRRFILVEMDANICRTVTAERLRRVCSGYTTTDGKAIEGMDAGFRFGVLGESLFDETGHICKAVSYTDLARHLFFAETGEPLPKPANGRVSPFIGICRGVAYYLLFNGILGDKRPDGGNILTGEVLSKLPMHDGPRVIFGEGCRLGAARLKRNSVTFKQIPYEIKVD
jgi:site-specific DNA-methyltransferase (adenine-specific)/adenine-specific DNA-methyltransferase